MPRVTVKLESLGKTGEPFETEFLVDTAAVDCLAPMEALRRAGVAVEGKRVYELADGRIVAFPYGFARVSFMGSETVAQVIFGRADVEPLLGVVALENTGIEVDPASQRLKRLAAVPLKGAMREGRSQRKT